MYERRDLKKFTPLLFVLAVMLLLSNYPPALSISEGSRSIPSHGVIERTPLLQGWGGVRLVEVTRFRDENGNDRTEPESEVFPGEVASNVEMTMRLLKKRGYNAIRAYFEDPRDHINDRDLANKPWERGWCWDSEWFEKFVELARYYDLWMICDYHGYAHACEYEEEWIQLWQDEIIAPYKDLYDKLVWEPCNEPLACTPGLTEEEAVEEIERLYQRWIDMCRALGDTHFIIASGKCWWSGLPKEDWYPNLHDPLDKTYLNFHFYFSPHSHSHEWNVIAAQNHADYWTDVAIRVQEKYNKPFMTTETGISDAQDGYDEVDLAFITRLIENFHREKMGYQLWAAGDWSGQFPRGLYGHMTDWGNEIPLPST